MRKPSRSREPNPRLQSIFDDYIDRPALQQWLGVGARTIRRYETDTANPLPYTYFGGHKHYHVADIEKWLANRKQRLNPRATPRPKPEQPNTPK